MKTNIITNLDTALEETLQLLTSFTEAEMNKVPFEGSWTAAQVSCHLYKAEKDMDKLLLAPSQQVDRQPDERREELANIFLNFETKFQSPDFIIPEDKHYTMQELEGPMREVKDKMVAAAKTADLDELAPLPKGHPFEGATKLEMVYFTTYHAMRHNRQIRNIKAKL